MNEPLRIIEQIGSNAMRANTQIREDRARNR